MEQVPRYIEHAEQVPRYFTFPKSCQMPEETPLEASDCESSRPLRDQLKLPKIIHFDELARCGEEVWIECAGQLYRLRKTRQNKLILTK